MKHHLKRKNELITTDWGGGSTTELFIYPSASAYKNRDFDVRISTATVQQSPSEFTKLTGYLRLLMPITDDLALTFDGNRHTTLKPYETVLFEGGWDTVSHGICTDIGIMFAYNWTASLIAIHSATFTCKHGFACLYSLSDNTKITADGETFSLDSGDFLVLETTKNDTISIEASDKIIIASVEKTIQTVCSRVPLFHPRA